MTLTLDARGRPSDGPSWKLIAAFVLGIIVIGGVIGATNAPDTWYRALEKPAWNPPDWVFGPVWTVLYGMVGYAGARVYSRLGASSTAFRLWLVQMVLNFLWTPLFFSAHSLPLASIEIGLLLAAVIAFTVYAGKVERVSAWLFVPYLAWVAFASALTWTIWSMNPGA